MIYAAILDGAWKMTPTSTWVPVLLHLSWLLLLYIPPMDRRSSCWSLPSSTGALQGAPACSLCLFSDRFRNPQLKRRDWFRPAAKSNFSLSLLGSGCSFCTWSWMFFKPKQLGLLYRSHGREEQTSFQNGGKGAVAQVLPPRVVVCVLDMN